MILIKIRLLQLARITASVGWPLLLIGLPLVLILLLGVFEKSQEGYTLAMLFGLSTTGAHFARRDQWHLRQLGYRPWQVFMSEYVAVALLFGLINVVLVGDWRNIVMMLGGAIVVAFIPIYNWQRLRSLLYFPVRWIPVSYFEWRCGLRKMGWGILIIITIGVAGTFVSPMIPLVSMLLIYMTTTSWYKPLESIAIFDFQKEPIGFLIEKSLVSLIGCLGLALPIALVFVIKHLEIWYLMVVAIFFGLVINWFAIMYKYACFHPARTSANSDVAVGIFSLCCLVPFFAPVCIFYLIVYTRRADKNLNSVYAAC